MALNSLLDQPIDALQMADFAQAELLEGRRVYRLGLAGFILSTEGELLVCEHPESLGEYASHSRGTVSEKLRYAPSWGEGMTETPYHAWQRGLFEELKIDDESFNKAGFFVDIEQPQEASKIFIGKDAKGLDAYYWTVSFIVRATNHVVLERNRPSDEVLRSYFEPIDEILASNASARPNYKEWVKDMDLKSRTLGRLANPVELEWQELPVTGDDVEFPIEPTA